MFKTLFWFASGLVIGAIGGYLIAARLNEKTIEDVIEKRMEPEVKYYKSKIQRLQKEKELSDQRNLLVEGILQSIPEGREALAVAESQRGGEPKSPEDKETSVILESGGEKGPEPEGESVTLLDGRRIPIVEEEENDIPSEAPYYEESDGVMVFPPAEEPMFPEIITEQQFSEERYEYEKSTVLWYEKDDMVVDDEMDPVDDWASLLGHEWILAFQHGDDAEGSVYVRNYRIKADFEIVRIDNRRYQDAVGARI